MKSDELKQLTWKYFWSQKYDEVSEVVQTIMIMWAFIGWTIGGMFLLLVVGDTYIGEPLTYTGNWWAVIPLALWFADVIVLLIYAFITWIKDNWKKAERRAQKQVNFNKLKGKKKK